MKSKSKPKSFALSVLAMAFLGAAAIYCQAQAQTPATTLVPEQKMSVDDCFKNAHDKEAQGKFREAESYYNIAVAGMTKEKTKNFPTLFKVYNLIGALNVKINDLPGAELAYRDALASAAQLYGAGNAELAKPLTTLALIYYQERKYIDAADQLKRALALLEKKNAAADDPESTVVREKLADAYERSGKYAESEALIKQSLELREKSGDQSSPQLLALLNCYSDLLHKMERTAEAEQIDYKVDQIHSHKKLPITANPK